MPATRATLLCHYRYDALDRLTGQGLTDAPPLQRFYCKNRLATEIQGALRQTLFQHDDWLLAQQQQQGVEHDTLLLATDQQRSVLNTLKANHQAQPIAYAPYGHRQATNGWMSLMGFNGERPDPLTGHYLLGNGYRSFNPVLMRFNSPDSWSPFDSGGLNAYAYALGNPVNRVDPTGHFSFGATGLLIGLNVVGLGLGTAGIITKNEALTYAGIGILAADAAGVLGRYFIGASTAKISNTKPLFTDHKRVYLAEQKLSKGRGKRLIIDAHGDGTRVDKYYPEELADAVLKKHPDFDEKFTNVKLMSCNGADGGINSYGQQLANNLNKPVKAYEGVMAALGPLQPLSRLLKITSTFTTTTTSKGAHYKYNPVIFTPNIRSS
jgi:RHS repeat-associated protein